MEIRTLQRHERGQWLALLDGWDLPDGWCGREFFARPCHRDPSYEDEDVIVAAEDGALLACVQIFPRAMYLLGQVVPVGGIGTVFTTPSARGRGISAALLERSVEAMKARGLELSLLFAQAVTFYQHRGWANWPRPRSIVRLRDEQPAAAASAGYEVGPFERRRDLRDLQWIHERYSRDRSGTLVRGSSDRAWQASLALAGNPAEEIWVARRAGRAVAYLRTALLYDVLTATELGRCSDAAPELAALVSQCLCARREDPLAPAPRSSRELRSFVLLPAFDDLALTVSLESAGLQCEDFRDDSAMVRCISAPALARRLGISLLPGESCDDFFARIRPPEIVFWPSDRF